MDKRSEGTWNTDEQVQGCKKLELRRRRNNAVSNERLEHWSCDGQLGLDVVIVDHVAT